MLRAYSIKTTKEKLMEYLLDQAKQHGSMKFTIPFDRQALADYLGVERSAMSAEISKLKNPVGLIQKVRGFVSKNISHLIILPYFSVSMFFVTGPLRKS
jgi:CRP-like cAMP-binding protein